MFFTSKNIISRFKKIDIFPYNPHKTFNIIAKSKSNIQLNIPDIFKIPLTSLNIHHIDRACRLVFISSKISTLLRAIYKLIIIYKLDTYKI